MSSQDIFLSKFDISTPSHPASDPNFRLGWLAFLVGKAKLLSPHPNLLVCFHLLVAVFNFLTAHMPKRRLQLNGDPSSMPSRKADGRIDTAASLAAMHSADPADVATLLAKLDELTEEILKVPQHNPIES
jgi:hypothetical protein